MSPRSPQSLWAVPWPPRAAIRPEIQGRAGARLCFPTLNPFVPFPWAWPRPTPQTALHTADCLPAPGSLPGTGRHRGSPPLALGVQTSLLGVGGTAESLPQLSVLLADPASHGHPAGDDGAQLFCHQSQRAAAEYLSGLACERGGFTGAVPHPGGKGVSTLECMVLTPVACRESTLQGGCPPPLVTRGWPAGSSGAQCLQRVASAFLPGHRAVPGEFVPSLRGTLGAGTPL